MLPAGFRYLRKGEIIEKDDRYWDWRYETWMAPHEDIGRPAPAAKYVRKLRHQQGREEYVPKTESDIW